jgi:hypothetical protein
MDPKTGDKWATKPVKMLGRQQKSLAPTGNPNTIPQLYNHIFM